MGKDHYKMYCDEFEHNKGLGRLINQLEATIKTLRTALDKYGYHKSGCLGFGQVDSNSAVCTCGLDKAKEG